MPHLIVWHTIIIMNLQIHIEFTHGQIIQFCFIVMDFYFFIASCWTAAQLKVFYWVFENLFLIFFTIIMFSANFYIFPFARFFGFAFRYFGRGIYYLILGTFLGKFMADYYLANFILGYLCAIACFVLELIVKQRPNPPLFQQTSMPSLYPYNQDYSNY